MNGCGAITASTAGYLEVTLLCGFDGQAVKRFPAQINEFLVIVKKLHVYGKIPCRKIRLSNGRNGIGAIGRKGP
jgi:hypothetical protein